jgi:hypothetical protein
MMTVEDDPLPLRVEGRLGMEGMGEGTPDTEEAVSDCGLIKSLYHQKVIVRRPFRTNINLPNSPHPLEPLSLTTSSESFHPVGIKQLEGA